MQDMVEISLEEIHQDKIGDSLVVEVVEDMGVPEGSEGGAWDSPTGRIPGGPYFIAGNGA